MRKMTLLLFLLTISIGYSQNIPVDFESDVTVGVNWKADSGLASVAIVADPDPTPSSRGNVGQINSSSAGFDWQNAQLTLTTNYIDLTDATGSSTITFDYYSSVAGGGLLKLEQSLNGAGTVERAFTTSGTGWETIAVDLDTPDVGSPVNDQYKLLVFFSGIGNGNGATDEVTYVHNISGNVGDAIIPPAGDPATAAPTPTNNSTDVISVYSDTYTSIATNLNPGWGQTTAMTEIDYTGNKIMKYANLNYQGLEYTNTDVSSMTHIHLDYYTDDATNLDFYLIAGGENAYDIDVELGITTGAWVSVDIEMATAYAGRDLANAFQFKTVGDGTVYLDNLYFWRDPVVVGTDATLSDLQVDGATISGFSSGTENYIVELVEGTVTVPQITIATPTDGTATRVISQATGIPDDATVVVTAADLTTMKTYTVSFEYTIPSSAPTPPSILEANVISIFSDAYTDVAATWNPSWGQSTVVTDEVIAANNVKKYSNFTFSGIEPIGGTIDVSAPMTHVNLSYWTSDATELKIKLVDYRGDGAWGGDNIEVEIGKPVTTGSWGTISISLSEFTDANALFILSDIGQLILTVVGAVNPVYIDDFYFSVGSALAVENYEIEGLNAYPNPTSDRWTISTKNETINSIEIFNVLGKSVISLNPNSREVTIDASNLATGMYFSIISTDAGTSTRKLIKK